MSISELIAKLGENKKQAANLYKSYKQLKEVEEVLKDELMLRLRENGLKSAKGEEYSASISERSDVVVTHEQSVIDWLRETPDVEEDAYIGLKTTNFKQFARQILKDTGEIIPGTDVVSADSISIKENK